MHERPDHRGAIRERLVDVRAVLEALGLLGGYRPEKNGSGFVVRCPAHGDKTPSCSVRIGPDRTIQVKCFGCDLAGDVFTLVAAARGLDVHRDFPRVLADAAELACYDLGVDARDDVPRLVPAVRPVAPAPAPPSYPRDAGDVWASCSPVTSDASCVAYLQQRGMSPDSIARLDLARALPASGLPTWARFSGRSWPDAGYRLAVPCLDSRGSLRSLRATRTSDSDTPKRLAPFGFTSTGLVFANPAGAVALLNPEAGLDADGFAIVEGEPDFWAASCAWPTWAVFGVYAGSWSDEIAARVPDGARVLVLTHDDGAGEKYARAAVDSLSSRCRVARKQMNGNA